jgi:hypothetical protein
MAEVRGSGWRGRCGCRRHQAPAWLRRRRTRPSSACLAEVEEDRAGVDLTGRRAEEDWRRAGRSSSAAADLTRTKARD